MNKYFYINSLESRKKPYNNNRRTLKITPAIIKSLIKTVISVFRKKRVLKNGLIGRGHLWTLDISPENTGHRGMRQGIGKKPCVQSQKKHTLMFIYEKQPERTELAICSITPRAANDVNSSQPARTPWNSSI